MTVTAKLYGGGEFTLDASAGSTPKEVVERLTADSLTGSAAPLADATLPTADGGAVRYGDVAELTFTEAF